MMDSRAYLLETRKWVSWFNYAATIRLNNYIRKHYPCFGRFPIWAENAALLFISFRPTIICRLYPPASLFPFSFSRPFRREFFAGQTLRVSIFLDREITIVIFLNQCTRRGYRWDFLHATSFILFKIYPRARGFAFFNRMRVSNKHDFCFRRCK